MEELTASLLQLITETSTNLPTDVRRAVAEWQEREASDTLAGRAVRIIGVNTDRAYAQRVPLCQDTGMLTFWVRGPRFLDHEEVLRSIHEAVATATRMGILRPNSVDSLTGKNSGLNLGPGTPVVHFEQHPAEYIDIWLLMKGGGCENQNAQYSLPCELPPLGRADRDLEGVYKTILHAIYQAQGHGCSAGFLGVCIGSDREGGYAEAKRQLLRALDDVNPVPELAALEERVMATANSLGIGAMGFGGRVTILGCKIGTLNRLPASFFVSVAYNCWAYRRMGVRLDGTTGRILEWRFRDEAPANLAQAVASTGLDRVRRLTTPLSAEDVRGLRVGDLVLVSGLVHTGRDGLHKYLMSHEPPVPLEGALIYHCGPVVVQDEHGRWQVKAAGPTTSMREEPYQADVLRKTGARAVSGKGGMGARTLAALEEVGAVYLNAIGGAAAFYADTVEEVVGVHLLEELGPPEAMWVLRVRDFPAVVTMDAHGRSLHAEVQEASQRALAQLGASLA